MFAHESNPVYTVYIQGAEIWQKTNRCQKINVQKLFNIRLQIEFYLITLQTYPTIESINQNKRRERVKVGQT